MTWICSCSANQIGQDQIPKRYLDCIRSLPYQFRLHLYWWWVPTSKGAMDRWKYEQRHWPTTTTQCSLDGNNTRHIQNDLHSQEHLSYKHNLQRYYYLQVSSIQFFNSLFSWPHSMNNHRHMTLILVGLRKLTIN